MSTSEGSKGLEQGDGASFFEHANLSASWQRSAIQHHVDPFGNLAPRVLSEHELVDPRGRLDDLIVGAGAEMDRLYGLVGGANYAVLLCDSNGVTIDYRGDELKSPDFRHWGIWLGGVWSEDVEGTNGVGTCIVEKRPVTVHRGQHFRARYSDLSCSSAPIFDVDGTLLAALDVSSFDPDCSEHAHALTGVLTRTYARAIEERRFRGRHHRCWVIALSVADHESRSALLAIDADQRIVAADRAARAEFEIDDQVLADGIDLWSCFERNPALRGWKGAGDLPLCLVAMCDGTNYPALITAPARRSASMNGDAEFLSYVRPRSDLLATLRHRQLPAPMRGGLSMRALRRVEDYLNSNLGGTIDLARLAVVAGVSKFHFARQFKLSTGTTPRRYLTRRRIERARELLAGTDLPLAEIAHITGFADQSHFGRQFRREIGTTPGQFRERPET